jgi:hypothetical protein
MEDHVGAVPLAVLHLANQKINEDEVLAGFSNVCSVNDHVCAIPLAVFHLANQQINKD